MRSKYIILITALSLSNVLFAKENVNNTNTPSPSPNGGARSTQAEACSPAKSQTYLAINNVKTMILGGGDMWWDLSNASYEIPKGGGIHSLFAGALWVGGFDDGKQLRVAAMTYRQNGNDFWPGPLDKTTATTTKERCDFYDKHFYITKAEVSDFKNGGTATEVIKNWPGNGSPAYNEDQFLAPFYDSDLDGEYNYAKGDYPGYNFSNDPNNACDKNQIYGDATLWWCFNDKGNIHTETSAAPIGLEVHAQAFAFSTNDEINDMTFYTYKIINRSSYTIYDTYFGQWVDPDLGQYNDDYVGCNVELGLGYVYNGDDNDDGAQGYGLNPPTLGIDFFEGPIADAADGIDNDRDFVIDEAGEQIIMSKFVFYNNDFSPIGNPEIGPHFYNYLDGRFKDGTRMCYGGNGWVNGTGDASRPCNFMFPGNTDKYGWGVGGSNFSPNPQEYWDERIAPNAPADRRFLQSAGKFTLSPGAVNYITVGVCWVRGNSGGATGSVNKLFQVDQKAQALFDNCFRLVDGPDAPELTIQELDKELILTITNKAGTNNYKESYSQIDPTIKAPTGWYENKHGSWDTAYRFQGYMVYQVTDPSVSLSDIITNQDENKAKLIMQCDIKDGVSKLVNFTGSSDLNNANVGKVMVKSAGNYEMDKGVIHSFRITDDAFALGSPRLVNHKKYYYKAIAYAYNNFKTYKQDASPQYGADGVPTLEAAYDGQLKPFLAGRIGAERTYTGMPHIPSLENGGTVATAYFGQQLAITRIAGAGNGGHSLDISDEDRDRLFSAENNNDTLLKTMNYKIGSGPFEVKVVDPLMVKSGDFRIKFDLDSAKDKNGTKRYHVNNSKWKLYDNASGALLLSSDTSINVNYEQLIPEYGISITINQVNKPGANVSLDPESVGDERTYLDEISSDEVFESKIEYKDKDKVWLSGVPDIDQPLTNPLNWIRSGTIIEGAGETTVDESDKVAGTDADDRKVYKDANQVFENILGGTWAPYAMVNTRKSVEGSIGHQDSEKNCYLWNLSSVDVVLTQDKTKWTRCPVIEMGDNAFLNEGGTAKHSMRLSKSVDKDGKTATDTTVSFTDKNSPNYMAAYGMGWFPGYAINIETGERLNMAFGEDSYLVGENGRDMLWNPTQNLFTSPSNYRLGGKHVIFVLGTDFLASDAIENDTLISGAGTTGAASSSYISTYDAGSSSLGYWKIVGGVPTYTSMLQYYELDGPAPKANKGGNLNPFYRNIMWAGYPLLAEGHTLLETDAVVKLRVSRPFKPFPYRTSAPEYSFSTKTVATITADVATAKTALELVNVVPNPYYAMSDYEGTELRTKAQTDNRIRITYLPKKCTVTIYTPNGSLIRHFSKDDDVTYIDWDLKNKSGVPITSGVYLIHVKADGIGEKVLKWFCVMRPIDLDSF